MFKKLKTEKKALRFLNKMIGKTLVEYENLLESLDIISKDSEIPEQTIHKNRILRNRLSALVEARNCYDEYITLISITGAESNNKNLA